MYSRQLYIYIYIRFKGFLCRGGSRGGGGYSGYKLVGVCPGTPKKGGLRCGHSPKRGVLGAGTAQKKGGLRCGHNQKKGGLRHVYNPKKGEFRTDLVKRECVRTEVATKGVLGAYLYIIFTFTWQYDQPVGVCSGRLKKGGLRCGHS